MWHGHYFKYLELARTELMRVHRLDVPDLVELGFHMMVVDAHCRYMRPLRYGERVRVTARFVDFDQRIVVA